MSRVASLLQLLGLSAMVAATLLLAGLAWAVLVAGGVLILLSLALS